MFPIRICRSGLSRPWSNAIQRNKSFSALFSQSPETVGVDNNKSQLDVSFRNFSLPHTITTPLLEDLPEIQKVQSFMLSVFPKLVNDIKTTPEYKEVPEIMDRLIEVLKWNVPHGKRQRSTAIFNGYRLLMEQNRQKVSPQEMEKVAKCCWCIELLHWFIIALDDIIDDSPLRRNKAAWFKVPGVGLPAINDTLMVEMYAYDLLKRHLDTHPSYVKLIELYHRTVYITHLGQGYDMVTKDLLNNKVKFEMFNMEKYQYLCKYKTTHYTFQNNLEMALAFADQYDPKKIEQVQPIFDELGFFFQVHNDCKDLFRNQGELITDDEIFLGTDIPHGKITWFVLRVLEDGDARQKKIIYDHYGKDNRESIEKVFKVYQEMDLLKQFVEYEDKSFKYVCEKTLELNNIISNDFFHFLIQRMYRRDPRLIWGNSK